MKPTPPAPSDIILYQTDDGSTRLEVQLQDETVWLSQAQMVELFQTSKQNVSLHIQNIFREGELRENSVVKESLTTAADGKDYLTKYYNLDVIISVGYRVKSNRGTQFRIWATQRLREYLIKGFTMDDERLKELGGGKYFDELLARIRDIRSSEKVFWRKVLGIYATSVDYDRDTDTSRQFFATMQNKMHWAAHGHTAAEVIVARADAAKPNMGLTTWAGTRPQNTLGMCPSGPDSYVLVMCRTDGKLVEVEPISTENQRLRGGSYVGLMCMAGQVAAQISDE